MSSTPSPGNGLRHQHRGGPAACGQYSTSMAIPSSSFILANTAVASAGMRVPSAISGCHESPSKSPSESLPRVTLATRMCCQGRLATCRMQARDRAPERGRGECRPPRRDSTQVTSIGELLRHRRLPGTRRAIHRADHHDLRVLTRGEADDGARSICFARPSVTDRPSGRVIPPLVAMTMRERSPGQVDSAPAMSRSL